MSCPTPQEQCTSLSDSTELHKIYNHSFSSVLALLYCIATSATQQVNIKFHKILCIKKTDRFKQCQNQCGLTAQISYQESVKLRNRTSHRSGSYHPERIIHFVSLRTMMLLPKWSLSRSSIHPRPGTNQIEYFYPRPCEKSEKQIATAFPTASGGSIYYAFSIHHPPNNRFFLIFLSRPKSSKHAIFPFLPLN